MSKYEERGKAILKGINEICKKEKMSIGDVAFNTLAQICSQNKVKKLEAESKDYEFKFTMELK